ncbi:MAG: Sua5/YciO/YrdC/YwlC family protein, partial [Bacteroidota bacterium]
APDTPLNKYAHPIPVAAYKLAEAFWPGPLSLLLPKLPIVPDLVTAGSPLVAIRKPAHLLMQQVLEKTDLPLAAPSANPSGYISPTQAEHVQRQLAGKISYVLDGGPSQVGLESTIVGFQEKVPVIYRHGGITEEAIRQVLGTNVNTILHSSTPSSPGMLTSHYAPKIPLYIGEIPILLSQFSGKRIGIISFQQLYAHPDIQQVDVLSRSGDLLEAASRLFPALHQMDQSQVEVILAEKVPDHGIGKAINDRLSRAQAFLK